jgi:NADH dehydrogenase [ubiquinone] 1 alpha subcomplex assembly factor 7
VRAVAERLAAQGGAALFIDYGHTAPRLGSTLQAVRAHRKVDAFAMPGEADLTAHVDFAAMAETAEAGGARWMGTAEQGPGSTRSASAHARRRWRARRRHRSRPSTRRSTD